MRLQGWHIIALIVVLVLLFGAKRLPDAARSLGRSMRILKAETRGLMDDGRGGDDLAEKADAKHGREPLEPSEIQQRQQETQQPPQQPVVDPVQRTREH
jgi:sec-independent protein translocase protein TatA